MNDSIKFNCSVTAEDTISFRDFPKKGDIEVSVAIRGYVGNYENADDDDLIVITYDQARELIDFLTKATK